MAAGVVTLDGIAEPFEEEPVPPLVWLVVGDDMVVAAEEVEPDPVAE